MQHVHLLKGWTGWAIRLLNTDNTKIFICFKVCVDSEDYLDKLESSDLVLTIIFLHTTNVTSSLLYVTYNLQYFVLTLCNSLVFSVNWFSNCRSCSSVEPCFSSACDIKLYYEYSFHIILCSTGQTKSSCSSNLFC